MIYNCRIVGDDDGGVMFTPEQYEAYKKRVIPMASYSIEIYTDLCTHVVEFSLYYIT
jgi:hypothetical protein